MYYPAIHTLALDLALTVTLINLTVTSYMIVSSITIAIVADLADIVGQRLFHLAASRPAMDHLAPSYLVRLLPCGSYCLPLRNSTRHFRQRR